LRLNPVTSEAEDTSEDDEDVVNLEDDCPPLGVATAENAARANEILSTYNNNNNDLDNWIDKYIETNRIQSSEKNNTLCIDEDIYVYDGIDIYE
jgi:hypothetical protein